MRKYHLDLYYLINKRSVYSLRLLTVRDFVARCTELRCKGGAGVTLGANDSKNNEGEWVLRQLLQEGAGFQFLA